MSRIKMPGVCGRCGTIGYRCVQDPVEPASAMELWVAGQVGKLLSLSDDTVLSFEPDRLKAGVDTLVQKHLKGSPSVAAAESALSRSFFYSRLNATSKPCLLSLVQLCNRTAVELVPLFVGEVLESPMMDSARTFRRNEINRPKFRYSEEKSREIILKAAKKAPPPTLRSVCRELGRVYAEHRFKQEFDVLRLAIKAHKQLRYKLEYTRLVTVLHEAARQLVVSGRPVTFNGLQHAVGLRVYQAQGPLPDALRAVLAEYGATIDEKKIDSSSRYQVRLISETSVNAGDSIPTDV